MRRPFVIRCSCANGNPAIISIHWGCGKKRSWRVCSSIASYRSPRRRRFGFWSRINASFGSSGSVWMTDAVWVLNPKRCCGSNGRRLETGMGELVDEARYHAGADGRREQDAEKRSPEMRVVIDVVAAAFGHIDRISQEQDCIEDGGHLDEVEIDGIPGADEDESEQYRAYCTGSAQAPIVVVVFPFEIGRDIGGDE